MSKHERFKYTTREQLIEKLRELGLDLPLSDNLALLTAPFDLAGRRLANRFVVQPMEGRDAEPGGGPGDLTFRRYRRFASGGAGTIWFEATAVSPAGCAATRQLHIHAGNVDRFRELTDQTRAAAREALGPDHTPLLILQLTHAGRYAKPADAPAPVIAQHIPALDEAQKIGRDHPLITDAELDRLQDDFAQAARLAVQAGFDGIDLKACHGYLLGELLAARTRADSRYGGSFENRTRFLLDALARIRAEQPGLLLAVRLGVYDGTPHPYGFGVDERDASLENLDEPIRLVCLLRERGCGLLNVTAGVPYVNPHIGRPFDRPIFGAPYPDEHPLEGVARLVRLTRSIQTAASELPAVASGLSWLRHHLPHVAASMIEHGSTTLVGIGRGAFAYPDCVLDLIRTGAFDPRKCCIGCSCCTQLMREKCTAGCVTRDELYADVYREIHERLREIARRPKES